MPRLHPRNTGASLPGGSVAAASSIEQHQHQHQRADTINSPPRIGVRRRSSGNRRSATERVGSAGTSAGPRGSGGSGVAVARQPGRLKQTTSSPHRQQQPSVGGGMMLSRSLGALGQAGAGRSTLAIVNTRDGGAPYLRSEKMSPKASVRAATELSSRRSPGVEHRRWTNLEHPNLVANTSFFLYK